MWRGGFRLALIVAVVAVAGCVHADGGGDVSADGIRDSFVRNEVAGYVYNGTTAYEFGTAGGASREFRVEVDSVVDYERRALRANVTSQSETPDGVVSSVTETYLVNRTVYSRTVRGNGSTGWVSFGPREANNTWEARDELSVYVDVLRNASVEREGTEEVRGTEAHRLSVGLDRDARVRLLRSRFGDRRSLFEEAEIDSFNTSVWITDDGRLLRSRTTTTMLIPNRTTRSGRRDIGLSAGFRASFSYGDTPRVEVPDEALDVPRARGSQG